VALHVAALTGPGDQRVGRLEEAAVLLRAAHAGWPAPGRSSISVPPCGARGGGSTRASDSARASPARPWPSCAPPAAA
jgi:hypothetical protein